MKFGPVPSEEAAGAVLAHSLSLGTRKFRKGQILTAEDAALIAQSVCEVTVAQLEPGDLDEDHAARRLASALAADHLQVGEAFTGRANLIAQCDGVLAISADIMAINAVDEAITLATLANHARVEAGQLVATIKIIPYGVSKARLEAAIHAAAGHLALHPFRPCRASLILTETPGFKTSLTAKAEKTIGDRLSSLGITEIETFVTPHQPDQIAAALSEASGDLLLMLGASATSDRRDVCPQALMEAGGTLTRFGMPVDPGNLLFLGALDGKTVIGLPGCARSPALNGADWVLERIVAGLPVSARDIAAMGEGGLLKEIPSRPQPRRKP